MINNPIMLAAIGLWFVSAGRSNYHREHEH